MMCLTNLISAKVLTSPTPDWTPFNCQTGLLRCTALAGFGWFDLMEAVRGTGDGLGAGTGVEDGLGAGAGIEDGLGARV